MDLLVVCIDNIALLLDDAGKQLECTGAVHVVSHTLGLPAEHGRVAAKAVPELLWCEAIHPQHLHTHAPCKHKSMKMLLALAVRLLGYRLVDTTNNTQQNRPTNTFSKLYGGGNVEERYNLSISTTGMHGQASRHWFNYKVQVFF